MALPEKPAGVWACRPAPGVSGGGGWKGPSAPTSRGTESSRHEGHTEDST